LKFAVVVPVEQTLSDDNIQKEEEEEGGDGQQRRKKKRGFRIANKTFGSLTLKTLS